MAVADLPHFSLRPNWSHGVTERLEWLTSILGSETGSEQRIALRLTPRRSFEARITANGTERALLDLAVGSVGAGEWWLPVWHDVGRTAAAASAGGGSLALDTTHREFAAGGYAMLWADAFTTEVVEIASVAADALTLEGVLADDWPAGTLIYPAVRARLSEQPRFAKKTDRLLDGMIRFEVVGPSPWTPETLTDDYLGYPVLSDPPDHAEDITHAYQRLLATLDGGTGLRRVEDTAGVAFTSQQYRWFLHRRQEHANFRSLLYALQGRRTPVWLPTFSDDLTLAETALSGATEIAVVRCGYARFGGPRAGRQDVRIELRSGVVLHRRITDAEESGDTETLTLATALSQTIAPADVRRISFMALNRLDQDAVEIVHHTDTAGVSTATATFRSTPESRVAEPWSPPALPQTTQTPWECGQEPTCAGPFLSGAPVLVDTSPDGFGHYELALAPVPHSLGGGLWVFYTEGPWYDDLTLRLARVSAAGAVVAGPATVHTTTGDSSTQVQPIHPRAVAVLDNGDVVVAWALQGVSQIAFAIYDDTGTPRVGPLTFEAPFALNVMVAARAGGGFVVAWDDDARRKIQTRFYDQNGLLDLGGATVVDLTGAPSGDRARLHSICRAGASPGCFVLAWSRTFGALNQYAVCYQVFQDGGGLAVTSVETVASWDTTDYWTADAEFTIGLYPRRPAGAGFRIAYHYVAFDPFEVLPQIREGRVHSYDASGNEQGAAVVLDPNGPLPTWDNWVGATSAIAWSFGSDDLGRDGVLKFAADGAHAGVVVPAVGAGDDYEIHPITGLDDGAGDADRIAFAYAKLADGSDPAELYVQFVDPCNNAAPG